MTDVPTSHDDIAPRAARKAALRLLPLAAPAAALAALAVVGLRNYLLFHLLAELACVAVAAAILMLAWNARRLMDNDFLLFIGIAYAFVSVLDLVHAMAYKGMGVFPGHDANLPTQLWIAARGLQAIVLLAAPAFLSVRLRPGLAVLALAAADAAVLACVFHCPLPGGGHLNFPDCYVEGQGQTPFKIAAEYVICLLLAGALALLLARRARLDRRVLVAIGASILATIASELAFTRYVSVFGDFNLLGHLLKLTAFYLIYKAVIQTGLMQPYRALFGDLAAERVNLQRIFDAANVGLLLVDEHGAVQRVNSTLSRWIGRDLSASGPLQPGDLVGCTHALADPAGCGHAAHCAACPLRRAFESVLRDGQPLHGVQTEAAIIADGKEVRLWLEVSADPMTVSGRRHVVLALNDVTERKRAEDALRQAVEELARSNKDLEQFAYVISHDLKEPLRMVTGFTGLLRQRYQGRLDATADEFMTFAAEAATRMQGLIDDLLSYARAGRKDAAGPADLSEALERAVANLAAGIQESGAAVTHDPLPTVPGSPVELAQVFQNLIGNAVKFRGDRPPRIHVGARRENGSWEVSVSDNGIGIDPQLTDRLFQIFQRLHTRDQYPGTGIGLAICKKIVERHGGRIWIESQPGQGASFRFTLPARTEDDAS